MQSLYLSRPVLASFEGEPPPPPAPPEEERRFSQEEVNSIMATEKRKAQAKIDAVEKTLTDTLAKSKGLNASDREALSAEVERLAAEKRSAEEQAAHERKQLEARYQKDLENEKKAKAEWESRYKEGTIENALQAAAVKSDAFSPDQVVTILRPLCKVVDVVDEKTGKPTGKHKVEIAFPDVDEDGNKVIRNLAPEQTTKRMKELTSLFGNLWKSGVVSGIGSGSGGGTPGRGGPLGAADVADVAKRSQSQYMEMRQKGMLPWAKPKR
jgi:hypothetical protein